MTDKQIQACSWHKVAEVDELGEGRVKTVTVGRHSICLTHHDGQYGALDNACPHQGGPLGEGSIENGLLRCPWHGWDYCPLSGKAPGFDDGVATHPVELRDDGVYVQVPDPEPRHRTSSDVMVETMVNWGVRWCFGMVGHSNLNVADSIRVLEEAGKMRFVGIRHEGAASFACSAYGKLTGRPAACLTIAGPGASNLLTGLWDAHVDRAPVVALTGQVSTQVLGTGNFQEIDLAAAFGGVAQWTATVLPGSRHAELAAVACKSAVVNRGVAHLIFPDEVAGLASDSTAGVPDGRVADQRVLPAPEVLDQALALLCSARRPVIVVGHGARDHMERIIELAEWLQSPVLTTFKAKGLIADSHSLAGGVLGRSGTPIASWCMNESDLLLVLGASFSNHTGITPKKPTIQVDADPMALAKFQAVDLPVLGELGLTVGAFVKGLQEVSAVDQTGELAERWRLWREEKARREADESGAGLASAAIFKDLGEVLPDNAIIAVDVGNNTYSFGRYFEARAQTVLMSGYLGSIGFSFPAALGAWAATQEQGSPHYGRKVVSISGDGGFGQYMAEINTAVKYGMDITHIVLNNNQLGKIAKEQRAGHWPEWQTGLSNPDFARYAELCGAFGRRVSVRGELLQAVQAALDHQGPALVEIISDVDLL